MVTQSRRRWRVVAGRYPGSVARLQRIILVWRQVRLIRCSFGSGSPQDTHRTDSEAVTLSDNYESSTTAAIWNCSTNSSAIR